MEAGEWRMKQLTAFALRNVFITADEATTLQGQGYSEQTFDSTLNFILGSVQTKQNSLFWKPTRLWVDFTDGKSLI